MAPSTYKPKPSQTLVDALQVARVEMVELRKTYPTQTFGICGRLPGNRAGDVLRAYISNSLGPYAFVESWLSGMYNIRQRVLTRKNLHEYRLMWIDQMIKDFTP